MKLARAGRTGMRATATDHDSGVMEGGGGGRTGARRHAETSAAGLLASHAYSVNAPSPNLGNIETVCHLSLSSPFLLFCREGGRPLSKAKRDIQRERGVL